MFKVAEMKSWLLALILLVLGGEAAVQDHSYSTPPCRAWPSLVLQHNCTEITFSCHYCTSIHF